MIGFKTIDYKKVGAREKSTFVLTQQRLRQKTGLHVVGFGATVQGHFEACALRRFWASLLLAAVVEVAVVICLKSLLSVSGGARGPPWRNLNFWIFRKKQRAVELFISIFENSSPKGSFRQNKINYEILQLSADSRYLQSEPLKNFLL